MKYIATIEVEFDSKDMWDHQDLKRMKMNETEIMQWLFKEEGFGIFDNDFVLTSIRKAE